MQASFSSLYIGILAATKDRRIYHRRFLRVSVPFTSGSSLQHDLLERQPGEALVSVPFTSGSSLQQRLYTILSPAILRFSSLYIGILAATGTLFLGVPGLIGFQFPLHRDPRCNWAHMADLDVRSMFQFPLHRDPRCN